MTKTRDLADIVRRILVLQCVVAAAHEVNRDDLKEWLDEEKLSPFLTKRECSFLDTDHVPKAEIIHMSWMAEAEFVLMWAAGFIDKIPEPLELCDTSEIHRHIPGLFDQTKHFFEKAERRTEQQILEMEQVYYDIHVDIRQSQRGRKELTINYNPDVVYFRHYALSWLTDLTEDDWDAVTADT